ncbi:hypothetical protein JHK82_052675 [Glycine max]|nr:hypothetical protein JHK86_052522 [Glycine max]KAG4915047.1 hypothetical protein JHK87_052604 [Glycine soja]KAG4926882.1 hypothetical protein JHK85_053368 [Glycine max]KAG5085278.1 hypothetical protein JHK82_052675 [Glycine max]
MKLSRDVMESGFSPFPFDWTNVPRRMRTKRKSKFNGKEVLSEPKEAHSKPKEELSRPKRKLNSGGSLEPFDPLPFLVRACNQLPDHNACCCWTHLKWPIQGDSNLRLEDVPKLD